MVLPRIVNEPQCFNRYRYALSLTSQFYFCGIPLRLDISPKCHLNCLYCFAMARGGRRTTINQRIDPIHLENKLKAAFCCEPGTGDVIHEMLAKRIPIHFGGMSDPFASAEISEISLYVLRILSRYDYPVILSTKNTELLKDPRIIRAICELKNIVVQISYTSADDRLSALIEPNVPPPSERLRCMGVLSHEHRIHTIARLQPLIVPWINDIRERLIPGFSEASCKHVIIEHLKIPVEKRISMFDEFINSVEWDARKYYKQHNAKLIGREWVLPPKLMWVNLESLIEKIHDFGMTYGSADLGLNHMGDTDCCCGIDDIPGFSNWFRGNISNVIRQNDLEEIRVTALDQYWYPKSSIRMYLNSNCRKQINNDVKAYLQSKWNSPNSVNAPNYHYGVFYKNKDTMTDHCVYERRLK